MIDPIVILFAGTIGFTAGFLIMSLGDYHYGYACCIKCGYILDVGRKNDNLKRHLQNHGKRVYASNYSTARLASLDLEK